MVPKWRTGVLSALQEKSGRPIRRASAFLCSGKLYGEGCAASRRVLYGQSGSVQPCQFVGDGKPQTKILFAGTACIATVESFEDLCFGGIGNARTVIDHRDFYSRLFDRKNQFYLSDSFTGDIKELLNSCTNPVLVPELLRSSFLEHADAVIQGEENAADAANGIKADLDLYLAEQQ